MLTEKEMEIIFQNEIPLESLVINGGIYEFHEDNGKSIGVSYEILEDEDTPVYIFNIFLEGEYINICEEFESIYDAVKDVTEEWNRWQSNGSSFIRRLDKYEMNTPQEKVNQDELFREMICYENDGKRIDMMAVIEHDGFVRAYNMDNGMYFNGDEEPNEIIPEDILTRVIEYAESQIRSDYENAV